LSDTTTAGSGSGFFIKIFDFVGEFVALFLAQQVLGLVWWAFLLTRV
jgi:hypothetical protein